MCKQGKLPLNSGSELCASTRLFLRLLLRNINVPYGHPVPKPVGTVGPAARRRAAGLQLWGQRASPWLLFPAGRWTERQADTASHSLASIFLPV